LLRAGIAELEMMLPEQEVKGAYEAGEEYEFYRDLKAIIRFAKQEVLIVDGYLDTQLFDIYVTDLDAKVAVRVMTDQVRSGLETVARKYAGRGNFELRASTDVHDRAVFADDRCWVIGQSIKDAARKKPTYIVEHTSSTMRPIYEAIWAKAVTVVKS
jgi:hypothetical protein